MSSSTATPVAYDVLVVGAGPSGLTTAISAARHGASVLVVDRHRGTSVFPKATGVRPRSMEILRTWGLEERLRASHQDVRVAMAASMSLVDPHQQEVSLGAPEPDVLAQVSPSAFAVSAQDELEPVLLDHLLSSGAKVRFEAELVDLVPDDNGHLARLQRVAAGAGSSYDVRARYVVGADGAQSFVRRLAGIGVRHLGTEGNHLAILFRTDLAERLVGRRYVLHMVTTPTGPALFVPSGAGRWLHDREWHPELGETLESWTEACAVAKIRDDAGIPDLDVELLGTFPWSFGAAVATAMRAGDVFLVGDAAHRTTPRGATGMNTGIADGHNLGWKLAWAARGWAGDGLLDSYAEERYPVGQANALASLEASGPDTSGDLSQDFGVVYTSSAVHGDGWVTAPPSRFSGVDRLPGAVPGARAPHAWVQQGGRRVSSLDLYDGRLTLLTGPGIERSAAVQALSAVGAPAAVVTVGHDVIDTWGELECTYRLDETDAVLVRPDGHIAWRASTSTADLRTALRTALGHAPAIAPSLV